MAALRHITRKILLNAYKSNLKPKVETCAVCTRLFHYTSIEYEEKHDPAPKFFNKEVQFLLRELTRVDFAKVNRKRKLETKVLADPEYKFMTDEELQQALEEAKKRSYELLQIPPVVSVRKSLNRIISKDPALQGLDESKNVFTDITFGIKDADRVIVVREPDGILREADWELRNKMNQIYFPKNGRFLKPPRMFFGDYFNGLLERKEYNFILDRACLQFDPNDPDYQRVVSITYQHVNDHDGFQDLRSTRHFGALTFFLVWHKNIDNLLLELIETAHIEETNKLLELYSKIHNINFEGDEFTKIEKFIKNHSNKKAALELGLQACKELIKQKQYTEDGIKVAHHMG